MELHAPLHKKPRLDVLLNGGDSFKLSDKPYFASLPSKQQASYSVGDTASRFKTPSVIEVLERESLPTDLEGKKACVKFFSTSGCPFGQNCHFAHYLPGGLGSLGHRPTLHSAFGGALKDRTFTPAKVLDRVSALPSMADQQPTLHNGYKTRLCKNYNTPEGCRFGKMCHFAHGENELRRASGTDKPLVPLNGDRMGVNIPPREPPPPGFAAASTFGAMSTAKISVDASVVGAIIGKGGVNSKTISRMTGARIYVKEHESDANLRNIEMQGSFDQIKHASTMIRELLMHVDVTPSKHPKATTGPMVSNFKTKLCDNFPKGACTFGAQCHFAHGVSELRHAPV